MLPGHYLVLDVDKCSFEIKKWWSINFNIKLGKSKKEWLEIVREQIFKSVKNWTTSDVNYGFSMSGGLDSTSLVAANANFSKNFNCYTLGFEEKIFNEWDERDLCREMKNFYNINLIEYENNLDDIFNSFHDIIASIEEPYGGGLPSYILYKEISKNEKVAISGVGGDEIFGNYNRALN